MLLTNCKNCLLRERNSCRGGYYIGIIIYKNMGDKYSPINIDFNPEKLYCKAMRVYVYNKGDIEKNKIIRPELSSIPSVNKTEGECSNCNNKDIRSKYIYRPIEIDIESTDIYYMMIGKPEKAAVDKRLIDNGFKEKEYISLIRSTENSHIFCSNCHTKLLDNLKIDGLKSVGIDTPIKYKTVL